MPITTVTPAELMAAKAVDYLANSFLKETPLFGLLADKVINQKQKAIEWGAKVAQGVTGGRAIDGVLGDDTIATVKGAAMSIPDFYIKHQFSTLKQDVVNATSIGKISAVRDPLATIIGDAFDILARKVQMLLYTGTGAADTTNFGIWGLNSIALQTGSYAGLSHVTYPRWKSILSQGTTPGTPIALTKDRLSKVLLDRRRVGSSYMNSQGGNLVIVTSGEIESDVLRKLYGQDVIQNTEWEKQAKDVLPYVTYFVRGIPVVSDTDCPANTAYLLNLNKIGLYSFDQSDMDLNNRKIQYVPLKYTDQTGDSPSDSTLWVRLADVSDEHPDLMKFELTTRLQMVAFDPIDSLTKIEDIANTI